MVAPRGSAEKGARDSVANKLALADMGIAQQIASDYMKAHPYACSTQKISGCQRISMGFKRGIFSPFLTTSLPEAQCAPQLPHTPSHAVYKQFYGTQSPS